MVSNGRKSLRPTFPSISVDQDEEPNAPEISSWAPENGLSPRKIGSLDIVSPLDSISTSQLQNSQIPLEMTESILTRHFLRVLSPRVSLTKRFIQFSIFGLTSNLNSLITVIYGGFS